MYKKVLCFVSGAIIGSAVTYILMYKKVDQELQEVHKFSETKVETKNPEPVEEITNDIPEQINDDHRNEVVTPEELPHNDYTEVLKKVVKEEKKAVETLPKPKSHKKFELLTRDDFDNLDEEENDKVVVLTYYADEVLADEDYNEVTPGETIGKTNFNDFLESYDEMFVKNNSNDTIYDIHYSNNLYSEVSGGY